MPPKQQQFQVQGMVCPFCKTRFPSETNFVDHLTKVGIFKTLNPKFKLLKHEKCFQSQEAAVV